MLTMFRCFDHKDTQSKRMQNLNEHLHWVSQNMQKIKVAGPLLGNATNNEDNKESNEEYIVGSLYIIEATSDHEAKEILQQDPYYQAQIWQQVEQHRFKDYAGTWVGGENWPGANNK